MATDREAVVWTRTGPAPIRMGRLLVTDTQCRFTYDTEFVHAGLPGLSVLYPPEFVARTTIVWERTPHFDLLPPLQAQIPPPGEASFQRRLALAYLVRQGLKLAPGFDSDWEILMVSGHGGIGHLDVFADDATADEWYSNKTTPALFKISEDFGFSLHELLTWMDGDAEGLIAALGPTPTVGGAIPKLLLSIRDTGWDGWIALPRKGATEGRTDILLKLGRDNYPGITALEALTLDIHREAGFEVPRHWTSVINGIPTLAIERYDRTAAGRPIFTESLYSIMAVGDKRITHHYSSSYDDIGRAIDASPLPIFAEPAVAKNHLLKRLLLSFATGNGDLHLENLSVIRANGNNVFSPVYDPTPMRAYSRHDLLSVMSFGDYGDVDARDQPIHLPQAIRRLAKTLGVSKISLRGIVEEALAATDSYLERVFALAELPEPNKRQLKKVVVPARLELSKVY
ncbi:MAG: type II toxin-antitoxin system HipA family toxin [Sulfuricaulis sp.]